MKAEDKALEAYPQRIESDSRGSYDLNLTKRIIYQQGYQHAETDLLWKLCEVRTLRLKYLHNEEALKAIEDVLEIFKDTLEILDKKQNDMKTEWDGTEIAPPVDSDVCG